MCRSTIGLLYPDLCAIKHFPSGIRRSIDLPLTAEDIFTSIVSLHNIWKCAYMLVYPCKRKRARFYCIYTFQEGYCSAVLNWHLTSFSYRIPQALRGLDVIDRKREEAQSHDPHTNNNRASNAVGLRLRIPEHYIYLSVILHKP